MTEPALQTERLVLRAPERSDFEEFAAMRADPVVARYTSGAPASADDTWQRLLRYRGLWGIAGFGYWVARERATGRFVGTIGFGDFRRGLTPSLEDIPEAGWVLASWCHGQGFATEGVRAALHWLDTTTDHTRSACIIDPGNVASRRIAEKNGFVFLTGTMFMGKETLMFERRR